MGLAMRMQGLHSYPELICDTCGEPIEDLGLALTAFEWPDRDGIVPVRVYHKGDCDPGKPGVRDGAASYWEGLNRFLPWLFWNHNWGRNTQAAQNDEDHIGQVIITVPRPIEI